jgi:hypothetical protein
MALPPSQQYALNAIDDVLQSAEPRLAMMFGVFTDLTRLEPMPSTETLPPGPWWARHRLPGHWARRYWARRYRARRYRARRYRAWRWQDRRRDRPGRGGRPARHPGRRPGRIVLIPLLLLAVAGLLVVSLAGGGQAGRRGCGQAVAAVMAAGLRTAVTAAGASGSTGCPAGQPGPTAGPG